MQMYRVKFARKISESTVDVGDAIVCANSRESAIESVATFLDLPISDTQFDAARVKPSFFQVYRKTIDNSIATFDAEKVDAKFASTATFPGVTENIVFRDWYTVAASADLYAESENDAICMLSRAIAREMGGTKQKRSLKNLDISCDRSALHPRTANIDQNALYEFRRIFQGGDTRT